MYTSICTQICLKKTAIPTKQLGRKKLHIPAKLSKFVSPYQSHIKLHTDVHQTHSRSATRFFTRHPHIERPVALSLSLSVLVNLGLGTTIYTYHQPLEDSSRGFAPTLRDENAATPTHTREKSKCTLCS